MKRMSSIQRFLIISSALLFTFYSAMAYAGPTTPIKPVGNISGWKALPVAEGGTGARTPEAARQNLGINTDGMNVHMQTTGIGVHGLGTMSIQNKTGVSITGGTISGITDLAVADGGTGASDASTARTNLGLGTISTQAANSVAITGGSISGITDLAVLDGGTGASDASTARTNLGLGTISTQAANNVAITGGAISGITDLAVADGGTGASDASTARTNLSVPSITDLSTHTGATGTSVHGLGTISTQASSSVSITGGAISGITDLAVADGGTGASTAANARTNLDAQQAFSSISTIELGSSLTGNRDNYFDFHSDDTNTDYSARFRRYSGVNGIFEIQNVGTGNINVSGGTNFTRNTNTIWHAGNDGAGSSLDADTLDGMHAADISASAVPSGSIIAFAQSSIPSGYLECNGAAISRSTYAALFSAISVTYGSGNGSTTFNLPDYRGEFLRGWNHSSGKDPDVASRTDRGDGLTGDYVGTKQADIFKAHTHTANNQTGAAYGQPSGAVAQSAGTTGSTGGNETRPRNINVMYIIKY